MISVYIIYSEKFDRFYVGQTKDVTKRLLRHNSRYEFSTSPYAPWKLILKIEKENRGEAMMLERKLKNLNRIKLKAFINKYGSQGPGRSEAGPDADRSVSIRIP